VLLRHADRYDPIMALILYLNISEPYPADRYNLFRDGYRIHKDIPALPFSQRCNTVPRPKREGYPKELKTIGDHIRKWRMDNHLLQKDVAEILGVCEDTIVGWEMRGTEPSIGQMPGIIKVIGYLPLKIDVSTFGGRIRYYRYVHGISQEDLAKELGLNESTIFHYEKNRHKPLPGILMKLEILLNNTQN
jgi:transcriptional regulator with XRE-family HTH domain